MSLYNYAQELLISKTSEKSKSPMLSVSMGMEPVMPMAQGGGLSTVQNSLNINGQPHRLAYINPSEENLLTQLGGSGRKIDGIPSYDSSVDGSDAPEGDQGLGIGIGPGATGTSNVGVGFDTPNSQSPAEAQAEAEGLGEQAAYGDLSSQAFGLGFGGDPGAPGVGSPDLSFKDKVINFLKKRDNVLDLVVSPVLPAFALRSGAQALGSIASSLGFAGISETADEAVGSQEGDGTDGDDGIYADNGMIREKIAAASNRKPEEVTVEEVERAKRLTAAQRVAGTRLEDILDQIYGSGKGAGLLGIPTNNTGTV